MALRAAVLFLVFSCASVAAHAQAALPSQISSLLATPEVARAHWGISILDSATGTTLYSLDAAQLFEPASNAKLFTTAAAMALLGAGTTFTTTVETDGPPPADGEVRGPLRLVGRGDPSMSGRDYPWAGKSTRNQAPLHALDELARQVAARGIRVIDGDIVGDDTLFAYERYGGGWQWDDLQWEYGAAVSALTVADNVRYLTVMPGVAVGAPVSVRWDPVFVPAAASDAGTVASSPEPEVAVPDTLLVSALTGAPGSEAHLGVSREVDGGPLRVFGVLPAGGKPVHLAVAVHDPALFAAGALKAALERAGVQVRGTATVEHRLSVDTQGFRSETRVPLQLPPGGDGVVRSTAGEAVARIVASRASPPLSDLIAVTNKVSQNLHAELLLRELGYVAGSDGSLAQGTRVVRQFALTAGVDPEDLSFVDGSGLSPEDLVTPRAITALLLYASRQPWAAVWKASLPIGGVDGSLAGRFPEPALKGRVSAKTGTLGEVNALSGFLTAASGRPLLFSILVNDATHPDATRKTMDDIVRAVAAAY